MPKSKEISRQNLHNIKEIFFACPLRLCEEMFRSMSLFRLLKPGLMAYIYLHVFHCQGSNRNVEFP